MPDDLDVKKLIAVMPGAVEADEAGGIADLTAIVGVPALGDECGWQAIKETIEQYGAQAVKYRIENRCDRALVEVWFEDDVGKEAAVHWRAVLDRLEGRAVVKDS